MLKVPQIEIHILISCLASLYRREMVKTNFTSASEWPERSEHKLSWVVRSVQHITFTVMAGESCFPRTAIFTYCFIFNLCKAVRGKSFLKLFPFSFLIFSLSLTYFLLCVCMCVNFGFTWRSFSFLFFFFAFLFFFFSKSLALVKVCFRSIMIHYPEEFPSYPNPSLVRRQPRHLALPEYLLPLNAYI